MAATIFTGPVITCRENYLQDLGTPVGVSANQNPDNCPSMFHMAMALLDPRPPYTQEIGQASNPTGFTSAGVAIQQAPTLGWLSATFQVADYTPGTASTTVLAQMQTWSGSSVTLTTSVANTCLTTNSTCTNAVSGATVTGLWRIDNNPAAYTFGTGTFGVWDPANPPIGRCISITSAAASLASTTFTISGYDAYGYPITQNMQGPAGSTATTYSTKAFKWISSVSAVAASTASAQTFSIGVSDTYGFPMYASAFGYINAFWNNSCVQTSAATTFTAGTPNTFTTSSDVRGTVGLAGLAASNGIVKLQMWQSVAPANLTAGALFGVTPA